MDEAENFRCGSDHGKFLADIHGLIWPRRYGAVARQLLFIVCGVREIFWGVTAVFVWPLKEMVNLTEKEVMHANEYTPRREGGRAAMAKDDVTARCIQILTHSMLANVS